MRFLWLLAPLVLASVSTEAQAACACRCVNQYARAVCDSDRDKVSDCRNLSCKFAPVQIRPNEAPRRPPAGATHCEQMQIYTISGRYEWTQLCIPENRSFHGLLKPASPPLPVPLRRQVRPEHGQPCGTDRDCPEHMACKRRHMNAPWQCAPR